MGAYVTPCARPDARPADWFIEKDGTPGDDDETLVPTDEQVEAWIESCDFPTEGDPIAIAREIMTEEARRASLIRRRQARDACFGCYVRTQCLQVALTDPEPQHGTWGGYYPEELRSVRRLRNERQRTRVAAEG